MCYGSDSIEAGGNKNCGNTDGDSRSEKDLVWEPAAENIDELKKELDEVRVLIMNVCHKNPVFKKAYINPIGALANEVQMAHHESESTLRKFKQL